MSNTIWNSKTIHLTQEVSVDVSASVEGVILGEQANHVFASDLKLTAEKADELGNALIEGARHVRAAQGEA